MPPATEEVNDLKTATEQQHGKAAQEQPESTTITVFDWDDTLLCSSFLSGEGYKLDSDMTGVDDSFFQQLNDLGESVINVLNLALSFGEVHIVTNAETGWVQLSAQKFMPNVLPLLSKIKIISARSTYESMYPKSPLQWKFYAIQDCLGGCLAQNELEKNILSFGDSHVEREAVRAVTRGVPKTKTKNIKFAERPSIEQLQRQIELVTNCFQYIHQHEGDLDLCMSLSVTPSDGAAEVTDSLPHKLAEAHSIQNEVVA